MLDAHSQMTIPPESHFPVRLWDAAGSGAFDLAQFVDGLAASRRFLEWGLDPSRVRSAMLEERPTTYADAIRLVFELYARSQGKPRYGDKTPGFVLSISFLAGQFPESRFVHVVRDGRDVALSLVQQRFGPTNVAEAASFWAHRVTRGRRDGGPLGPERYLEVRYESLVAEPKGEVARMCEFLGLAFEPQMPSALERGTERVPEERRANHPHLGEPLRGGIRDWRRDMPPGDVALFEAVAGSELEAFGYERALQQIPAGVRLHAGVRRMGSKLARSVAASRRHDRSG